MRPCPRLQMTTCFALIFSEGEPGDAFIAIVTGRVKVFKSTPAGKTMVTPELVQKPYSHRPCGFL